ncbi:MAG: N-acetylmuramoyl-L-alanine amidase [Firmicutes bacterium]|nr:N-acetylmuramoyl-L-alanine amidase [Bacillota bacterium]
MATIIVDAGHGGEDWGATRYGRMEKADNVAFAVALGRELTRRGHNVIYTRQTDVFIPLNERARISNNAGADLFVSVHRNSHTTSTANGFENIVRHNASAREVACAQSVINRVNALGVFANRGLQRGDFVVLTATQAPAMLVEYGFISNAGDNTRFDQNFTRLVNATADGIGDCLGSGGTVPPPPPPPPQGGLNGTVRVTSGALNVRAAPNTGSAVLGQLQNNASFQILGEQNGWLRLNFQGRDGWVSSQFVNVSGHGNIATSGSNLNMRSSANATAPVVTTIPNGTRIPISAISGNFFQTTFGGRTGWVSRDFVRI